MNVIVPAEERRMFQDVKQAGKEMMKAHDDFVRAQKHLTRALFVYSKLKDAILAHFEVFTIARIFNPSSVEPDYILYYEFYNESVHFIMFFFFNAPSLIMFCFKKK